MFKKLNSKQIKKLPSILLSVLICLIAVISLVIMGNKLMEYVSIKKESDVLKAVRENKLREIDELKYYINSEIDDDYKERMARLLGYCYPDESIYYVE